LFEKLGNFEPTKKGHKQERRKPLGGWWGNPVRNVKMGGETEESWEEGLGTLSGKRRKKRNLNIWGGGVTRDNEGGKAPGGGCIIWSRIPSKKTTTPPSIKEGMGRGGKAKEGKRGKKKI